MFTRKRLLILNSNMYGNRYPLQLISPPPHLVAENNIVLVSFAATCVTWFRQVVFTCGLRHGGIVVTQWPGVQSFEGSTGVEHLRWLSHIAGI